MEHFRKISNLRMRSRQRCEPSWKGAGERFIARRRKCSLIFEDEYAISESLSAAARKEPAVNLEKGRGAHETPPSPPALRGNAIPHSFARFLGEKGVRLNELKRRRASSNSVTAAEYRFIYALRCLSKKIISSLTILCLSHVLIYL